MQGAPTTLFGRNIYNRTQISNRLKVLCEQIRSEAEHSNTLLLTVADTLNAVGIFSPEQIQEITELKTAPEAERTKQCNYQIITTP